MTGWLLVRLWRGQGREQWSLRLVMLAVVALCTLVILTVAAVPGTLERQARTMGWTSVPPDPSAQALAGEDSDWVAIATRFAWVDGERVSVVIVGRSGRGVPEPPGLVGWPEPGTARLSPAVRDLLSGAGLPADYFGRAELGFERAALRGPDDLLVVMGARPEQVDPVAIPLKRLGTGQLPVGPRGILPVVLGLAGAAVLVPPLLLAGTVLRSTIRTSRRRIAMLRIAGLSRRSLRAGVVLDHAAVGLLGWVMGVLAFWLGRPALSRLPTWEIQPWATELHPPLWVHALALVPPLLICLASAVMVDRVASDPLAGRVKVERSRTHRELSLVAGAATVALVILAPRGSGMLAPATLGALVVLLVAPSLLHLIGGVMTRSRRAAMALAGAQLRGSSLRVAVQVGPTALACYVLAVFLVVNPAAVASVQSGVIAQGEETALIRARAADRQALDEVVGELRALEGVRAVADVYVGAIPSARSANVWFGRCEDAVAASSLPDHLCSGDDVMWATPSAREALASSGRVVRLPDPASPESMNAIPDEDQPVEVTVPDRPTGVLDTPENSWDLPVLLLDPGRAGMDLTPFRATGITVSLEDRALDGVGQILNAAVPTATVTTKTSGNWGFAGGLERYYAQLLTGGLAIIVVGAVAAAAAARAQQVESARAHAALHAAGLSTRTLRQSVGLMMSLPVLTLGLVGLVIGVLAGVLMVPGGPRYLGEALGGLVPLVAGVVVAATLVLAWARYTGPPIGAEQLRVD